MPDDPIQRMQLEEKRRVVDQDKALQQAKKEFGEAVNKAMPEVVKGGETLELVLYPDARLRQVCETVEKFDSEVRELLKDMAYTMYMCGGVGLSGPQVGQLRRLFVADWSGEKGKLITVVNPDVLEVGPKSDQQIEGCLSFPGVRFPVERPLAIRAHWWTEHGKEVDLWLEGWAARIFLHEVDHLDGKIYLDRVSMFTRRMALKKMNKIRQKVERDKKQGQRRKQKRGWR